MYTILHLPLFICYLQVCSIKFSSVLLCSVAALMGLLSRN